MAKISKMGVLRIIISPFRAGITKIEGSGLKDPIYCESPIIRVIRSKNTPFRVKITKIGCLLQKYPILGKNPDNGINWSDIRRFG